MAAGTGTSGFGTIFKYGDTSPASNALAEIRDVGGPSFSVGVVDITHQTSPDGFREKKPGLGDGGEVTVQVIHNHTDVNALYGLLRVTKYFQILMPDTHKMDFSGHITGMSHTYPLEDVIVMDVTIAVNGKAAYT